jgi:hypothetical protein
MPHSSMLKPSSPTGISSIFSQAGAIKHPYFTYEGVNLIATIMRELQSLKKRVESIKDIPAESFIILDKLIQTIRGLTQTTAESAKMIQNNIEKLYHNLKAIFPQLNGSITLYLPYSLEAAFIVARGLSQLSGVHANSSLFFKKVNTKTEPLLASIQQAANLLNAQVCFFVPIKVNITQSNNLATQLQGVLEQIRSPGAFLCQSTLRSKNNKPVHHAIPSGFWEMGMCNLKDPEEISKYHAEPTLNYDQRILFTKSLENYHILNEIITHLLAGNYSIPVFDSRFTPTYPLQGLTYLLSQIDFLYAITDNKFNFTIYSANVFLHLIKFIENEIHLIETLSKDHWITPQQSERLKATVFSLLSLLEQFKMQQENIALNKEYHLTTLIPHIDSELDAYLHSSSSNKTKLQICGHLMKCIDTCKIHEDTYQHPSTLTLEKTTSYLFNEFLSAYLQHNHYCLTAKKSTGRLGLILDNALNTIASIVNHATCKDSLKFMEGCEKLNELLRLKPNQSMAIRR